MDYTKDYVQILKESLEKKLKLLEQLVDYNSEQKNICSKEEFDIEAYDRIVDAKDNIAEEISTLDDGFSLVYDRVSQMLKSDKDSYKEEIQVMQGYIAKITEMISSVQADEKRMFEQIKGKLEQRRGQIGKARKTTQIAANYYKSMSRTSSEPQFMDKKN